MKKFRNVLALSILLLSMFTLTGCNSPLDSVTNWWNGIQSAKNSEDVRDNLSDVASNTVSKSTKEAADKLAKAQSKKDNQESVKVWEIWKWKDVAFKDNVCFSFNAAKQEESLSAKVEKAYNNLKTKKACDPVYLASKEGKEEEDKQNKMSSMKKMLPIILIIVVIVVALVILVLLKRPKPEPKPEPIVEKPALTDAKQTEQLSVNYEKLLKHSCKKADLSYDEVLQCHQGDARKAYESINYMIGNNLSKDEMLSKMKGA